MNPEHHRPLRESLGAHAMGHLTEPEDAAVREHLSDCAACRAELDEIAPIVALLDTVDPDALKPGGPEPHSQRADPLDRHPHRILPTSSRSWFALREPGTAHPGPRLVPTPTSALIAAPAAQTGAPLRQSPPTCRPPATVVGEQRQRTGQQAGDDLHQRVGRGR